MSDAVAMSAEDRRMLVETAADLFGRTTPLVGRDTHTEPALGLRVWRDVEQADLGRLGVAPERGGAGGGIGDAAAVLRAAARFAPPIPLAETQLGAWLAAEAGLEIPPGALAVGPTAFGPPPRMTASGLLSGTLVGVPFAGMAAHLVVLVESGDRPQVAVVRMADAAVSPFASLSGEPWATVDLAGVRAERSGPVPVTLDDLLARGALSRAQQIAGALERVLELAVSYAGERVQFGRPIARFQAIQHHLAEIAGEVVAAGMAAEAAIELADAGRAEEAAAIAKIRTGLATRAATIAHQVHGAIGVTEEHPLHLFTRRVWDWRDDFGTDSEWAGRLGRRIARAGSAALWPEVSEIL